MRCCNVKKKLLNLTSYILVAALASVLTLAMSARQGMALSKLDQLESLIDRYYIDDVDKTALEDAAAEAMVSSNLLDRWSYYIPASEYETYLENSQNAYVGIGVTIAVAHDSYGIQILTVNPNSPAQEAGLQVDDVITEIEGHSTGEMTTTEARNLVRGKEGSTVTLTVWRNGQTMTIPVVRKKMGVTVAAGQLLEGNVGYVSILNFDDRCSQETIAAVEELLSQGAESMIFDVRNNPGGYAHELVKLLDYLLPEGDLFRTMDFAGREQVDTSGPEYLDIPMAVLVNGNSFSAAEFFAAALQEYEAAVVVGEKTTGKGHFQSTFPLRDGSAVALSIGRYYTPKGVSLEGQGITPDVECQVDTQTGYAIYAQQMDPQEDPQIQAAVQALETR